MTILAINWGNTAVITGVGFGLVFLVLVLLIYIVKLFGVIFAQKPAAQKAAPAAAVAAAAAVIVSVSVVSAAAEKKNKDDDPPAAVIVSEHEISPRKNKLYRLSVARFAGMLYDMKTVSRWLQNRIRRN